LKAYFPNQFADWKELVKQGYHDTVASLMDEYASKMDQLKPKMPAAPTVLFPPPALYSDRRVERVVDMFQTDVSTGLASSAISKRVEHYGQNILPSPPKP
jgi:hypothetical protein